MLKFLAYRLLLGLIFVTCVNDVHSQEDVGTGCTEAVHGAGCRFEGEVMVTLLIENDCVCKIAVDDLSPMDFGTRIAGSGVELLSLPTQSRTFTVTVDNSPACSSGELTVGEETLPEDNAPAFIFNKSSIDGEKNLRGEHTYTLTGAFGGGRNAPPDDYTTNIDVSVMCPDPPPMTLLTRTLH